MLTEDKITEIFVMTDKFCKIFDAMLPGEVSRKLEKAEKDTILWIFICLRTKTSLSL